MSKNESRQRIIRTLREHNGETFVIGELMSWLVDRYPSIKTRTVNWHKSVVSTFSTLTHTPTVFSKIAYATGNKRQPVFYPNDFNEAQKRKMCVEYKVDVADEQVTENGITLAPNGLLFVKVEPTYEQIEYLKTKPITCIVGYRQVNVALLASILDKDISYSCVFVPTAMVVVDEDGLHEYE